MAGDCSLTAGVEKASCTVVWRDSNSCTRDLLGLGRYSQGTAGPGSSKVCMSCSQVPAGLSWRVGEGRGEGGEGRGEGGEGGREEGRGGEGRGRGGEGRGGREG